jgi:DNA-binding MarR family transcriptional regulator
MGRAKSAQKDRSFGYLMRDTTRLLLGIFQDKLGTHGITLSQNFILRELWEEDELTMGELAARVRIVEPSVATSIDALERQGIVTRVRSSEDRRRVHVRLTPAGGALRLTLLRYAAEMNEIALRGVGLAEVEIAKTVLQQVKDNLSDHRLAQA